MIRSLILLALISNYILTYSTEIYHYQDSTMNLTINDISSMDSIFSKLPKNRFTYPIGDYHHWFKFRVKGNGKGKIVYIDEPYIDSVSFYKRENSSWIEIENGLQVPIKDRITPSRLPAFTINLKDGEVREFYLRVYSARTLLNTGIEVKDVRFFTKEESIIQSFYLIFIGSMISILIYNLFIYIRLKERVYLYYILFGLFLLIWVLLYSGFDIFIYNNYRLNHILSISIVISSMALVLFYNSLLKVRKYLPVHYKLNRVLLIYMAVIALLTLLNIKLFILVIISGLPIPVYLIYISFISYKKGLKQSSYLLFGMSWYVVGLIILSGKNLGILPFHQITRYIFIIGSYIEFITFSMALASRLDTLQKALMKRDERNIEKLEYLVKERTIELREANIELKKMAISDSLTALYNRRYFKKRLESEWSRLSRTHNFLTCLMIDVDHFKLFNDTYGHLEGDKVLESIAQAIKEVFARSSDICCRFGGEEFVVILPETDITRGEVLGNRLLERVKELKIPHCTHSKIVTISIGLSSIIPTAIRKKETILQAADKALYLSKERGRNQVSSHT